MNNISEQNRHLEWSQDLSVGVSEIDADHKVMFQLFNEVHLLSNKEPNSAHLSPLVSELVAYT